MEEKRAHRWVHIVEEEAKRLEQDEDNPLLANVYHEFVKENRKYREYHIDTHPEFEKLEPKVSIRCPSNTKPLILIGQDESCFKQNSFSKKCWTGPSGVMKLLLKSDGYTWMISAFISRDFGVGLVVNDGELELINQRRQIGEWSHYI